MRDTVGIRLAAPNVSTARTLWPQGLRLSVSLVVALSRSPHDHPPNRRVWLASFFRRACCGASGSFHEEFRSALGFFVLFA